MSTYVALADVNESEFQNAQELAAIWGEVRTEFADERVELQDAYVLLGGRDVLMILDAPDREAVLKASFAVERHGLHVEMMEAIDVAELGRLVDEI